MLLSALHQDLYVEGVSVVAHRVMDLTGCDAFFLLVAMENRVFVTARSRGGRLDVAGALAAIGGGGHTAAASAVVKDRSLDEVAAARGGGAGGAGPGAHRPRRAVPPRPIVAQDTKVDDAALQCRRDGLGGVVIAAASCSSAASRSSTSTAPPATAWPRAREGRDDLRRGVVPADMPLDRVAATLSQEDIGWAPVVAREQRMAGYGAATCWGRQRRDRGRRGRCAAGGARRRQCRRAPRGAGPGRRAAPRPGRRRDRARRVPGRRRRARRAARRARHGRGHRRGGRRHRLRRGPRRAPQGPHPAASEVRHRRRSCRTTAAELRIDVASTRSESYEYPAALPKVQHASIRSDLARRDFTINAMAVSLKPETFGNLLDYFGGRTDLDARRIVVLHNLSFIEDPRASCAPSATRAGTGCAWTSTPSTWRAPPVPWTSSATCRRRACATSSWPARGGEGRLRPAPHGRARPGAVHPRPAPLAGEGARLVRRGDELRPASPGGRDAALAPAPRLAAARPRAGGDRRVDRAHAHPRGWTPPCWSAASSWPAARRQLARGRTRRSCTSSPAASRWSRCSRRWCWTNRRRRRAPGRASSTHASRAPRDQRRGPARARLQRRPAHGRGAAQRPAPQAERRRRRPRGGTRGRRPDARAAHDRTNCSPVPLHARRCSSSASCCTSWPTAGWRGCSAT